ncbi:MAG: ATP-binding protein [Gordonia sp. (in: high G+C Gram-positive bacteria)]|uniref:sensor histidine kinase n=1 Tax=Gordonia sp. (in: high G+C Gram-positive bacteria) TaxID=84139 RepID=UPI003C71289C
MGATVVPNSAAAVRATTPRSAAEAVAPSEHSKILVAMSRFIGAGFVAYFLTSIPMFGQPAGMVAGWFTPVGIALAFGPGFALLAVSFVPRLHRYIPVIAPLCAVGYLLAAIAWFVAWNGITADAEQVTWLMSFSGLPAMAWVLVRPMAEATGVLVVCSALAAWVTDTGRSDLIDSNVLIEGSWGAVFTLCFVLASGRVVRSGRILDATRADAIAAAGESAARSAQRAERARFDALIHDQVIATLISAANDPTESRLPYQARRATSELLALASGAESVGSIDANEVQARLRAVVASVDHDVAVIVDSTDPDTAYPTAAVQALAEAVGEAVRNSIGHAGPDAECAVLVEVRAGLLRITVADNGAGFDTSAVPPERLGIEVSIRQRLRNLDGADMRLSSVPGEGTTVQMMWQQP